MFDSDAYLESLAPPSIRIDGKTYRGRVLSLPEWAPIEPYVEKIQNGEAALSDAYEVIGQFCRSAFPRPLHMRLMFWRPWVREKVLDLPPAAMLEAMEDFFGSQARAMGVAPDAEESGGMNVFPPAT